MSTLVENVAKVTAAHAALKTSIAAKGVAVPDGTKLTDMPALVEQIPSAPAYTSAANFYADNGKTSIDVPATVFVDFTSAASLYRCFADCADLTTLTFPVGFGKAAENLGQCFIRCGSLESLALPDGFGQAATDIASCFFSCAKMTSLALPAGFGGVATDASRCFQGCAALESLALPDGFGQAATTLYNCFANNPALTSLTLPAGFGQNATNLNVCFRNCSALAEITGNPSFKVSLSLSPCPNLTHDSLMVVINGLQTVTTSQTLTLGTANLAKLTDEEKKVATDKGWTLA